MSNIEMSLYLLIPLLCVAISSFIDSGDEWIFLLGIVVTLLHLAFYSAKPRLSAIYFLIPITHSCFWLSTIIKWSRDSLLINGSVVFKMFVLALGVYGIIRP